MFSHSPWIYCKLLHKFPLCTGGLHLKAIMLANASKTLVKILIFEGLGSKLGEEREERRREGTRRRGKKEESSMFV